MTLSRKTTLSSVSARHLRGESERNLILWIGKGDEAAFRLFYDATNGLLFGLLLRILGHTQTAEEVLAELYLEVREKASHFGKQNERPLTWLIFIAHRRAIECLCRRLATQTEISRGIGDKSRSSIVTDSYINITEQRRRIRAAMDSISLLQQKIIELTFFSGMTKLEVARQLGESLVVVEDGFRYAMIQLFRAFHSKGLSPNPTREVVDET